MKYIPQSRIQKGLVSKGELVYKDNPSKDYYGLYWLRSNGTKYVPSQTGDLETLVELVEKEDVVQKVQAPYDMRRKLSEKETVSGQYTRFFIKKQNEEIYYELDEKTYVQYQNKSNLVKWQLYSPFTLEWKVGSTEDNKNTVDNLVQNRNSIVTEGFYLYLGI